MRYMIELRGYKQVELAEKVGITQAAISNILTVSTRRPNSLTLLKLCGALQCSPEWLMTGVGDPEDVNTIGERSEQELLGYFRSMTEKKQAVVLAIVKGMADN